MNFILPVPDASLLAVEICSDICSRKDQLCVRYTVVLDEYDFQLAVDGLSLLITFATLLISLIVSFARR